MRMKVGCLAIVLGLGFEAWAAPGDPLRLISKADPAGGAHDAVGLHLAKDVVPQPVFEYRKYQYVSDGWEADENNVLQPKGHYEWGAWQPWDTSSMIMVPNGGMAEIRAATDAVQKVSGIDGIPETIYHAFSMFEFVGGPFEATGDVTTLLRRGGTDTVGDQGLGYLFFKCANLLSAPELPATKLGVGCYSHMFEGSSIVEPPALPAASLADACYQFMFAECTKLTGAPALPATELKDSCYQYMFAGAGIARAPELPAMKLANHCYEQMFRMCPALETPPELPATTLCENCYWGMFDRCAALKSAPLLPARTLTDGCYVQMFNGCPLISDVTVLATSFVENDIGGFERNALEGWLTGVAAQGTLTCPNSLTLDGVYYVGGAYYDFNLVPTGWTVVRIPDPEPIGPDPVPGGQAVKTTSEADVVGGVSVAKATTRTGVLLDGSGAVAGRVEIKVGKAGAKGSKISGSLQLLGGKKISLKGGNYDLASGAVQVELTGKGVTMSIKLGSDASGQLVFAGTQGAYRISSAAVGGAMAGTSGLAARLDPSFRLGVEGEIHAHGGVDFAPYAEPVALNGAKWVLGKAASVKFATAKGSTDKTKVLQGYDDPKKPNVSGLKLGYTAKTGAFKGSFKVYALQGAAGREKLRKYTVNVTGIVVDGRGFGIATCKKPQVGPFSFEVR